MMESYLGDGLYASMEGDQIRLRAPRRNGDHWVGLEPAIFLELLRFANEHGFEEIIIMAAKRE